MRLQQYLSSKEQLLEAAKLNPTIVQNYVITKYLKTTFIQNNINVDINLRPKVVMNITWVYHVNIHTDDIDKVDRDLKKIEFIFPDGESVVVTNFSNKSYPQIQQWIKSNAKIKN